MNWFVLRYSSATTGGYLVNKQPFYKIKIVHKKLDNVKHCTKNNEDKHRILFNWTNNKIVTFYEYLLPIDSNMFVESNPSSN